MSNSNLICYTKISPNKTSPRNHKIDTISIHCMAGDLSVETCGNVFAPSSRQASSNYGIGSDGRIAMYVEEKDRSWCTSSASNDNRAVTIEVANDGGAETGWHVSDKAYKALIDLVTDICRRNGIKRLLWKGDKALIGQVDKQNMTVHRWFAAKACPGDYLYNLHGQIAAEVNKRLGAPEETPAPAPEPKTLYRVQIGAYSVKANAEACLQKAKAAGFADAFIVEESKGQAAAPAPAPQITAGSTVRVKEGAKTYTGGGLASFVYGRDHTVKEISGDRAVITFGGVVVAAVKLADLTLV